MGKGKRYTVEYKKMIVDLYKSGVALATLSSEYGIAKSTVAGWVKDSKEIKIDENEIITVREFKRLKKQMAKLQKENEILKKAVAIFAKKI